MREAPPRLRSGRGREEAVKRATTRPGPRPRLLPPRDLAVVDVSLACSGVPSSMFVRVVRALGDSPGMEGFSDRVEVPGEIMAQLGLEDGDTVALQAQRIKSNCERSPNPKTQP